VEILGAARDECVRSNEGGAGNSSLYRVDPNTAEAQLIGDIGFKGVTGFAFLPDGRLVASARGEGEERSAILIEINPVTGAGSLIGTIGEEVIGECARAPGLSVDPMTSTLFATGDSCPESGDDFLQTVNPSTGEGTLIGTYDPFNGSGNGLAVSNNGVFFVTVCCSEEEEGFAELITVNPISGAPTFISKLTLEEFIFVNALAFHPLTGELFGSTINETESPDIRSSTLVKINTATGATTTVGDLPDCFDGIVFRSVQTTVVPTLSEWGLIAMAGVLAIIGLLAIRRRKVTA